MKNFAKFVTLAERLGKVAASLSTLTLSICLLLMIYNMLYSA